MAVSLASLLIQETKDTIYAAALGLAAAVGLNVTSWQPGDPTRALFNLEAETLSKLEDVVAGFISSGFLDYASGDWLVILAQQVFGVTAATATYASTAETFTNSGGGVYIVGAGDITIKSSVSGMTFHNTQGGTIPAGGTLTLNVEADLPGAASSAGAGEIDTMVTTLLGVTCTNATSAVGTDAQDDASLRQQCRDRLGALSPNGPKDAYAYVARNAALTGNNETSRVRVYSNSNTGRVTIYLAGPSGAVSGAAVTAVTNAIGLYATPLCITPTIASASNLVIPVTYTVCVYNTINLDDATIQASVLKALQDIFAARPIGGDIVPPGVGVVDTSLIEGAIQSVSPKIFKVIISLPSASYTALTAGQVAVLGTVTPNITRVDE